MSIFVAVRVLLPVPHHCGLILFSWMADEAVFTGMLTSLTNSVSQSVTAASLSPQSPASSVAFKRRLAFLVFVLSVQWLVQDSSVQLTLSYESVTVLTLYMAEFG